MLLVRRQERHPAVKYWVVGCWSGYPSGARCRFTNGQRCHCHLLSLAPVNPDWFYLPGLHFW